MTQTPPDPRNVIILLSNFQQNSFVERYGGLYEHSPWIAEAAWLHLNSVSQCTLTELATELKSAVETAEQSSKLSLIRAHPDLVGKAAVQGELTEESTTEQASARLDQCTPEEFQRFNELNSAYKEKFGFPFVMAVRKSNRVEILKAFSTRLDNTAEDEFRAAIDNIHDIAWMRLLALELPE